MLSKLEPVVQKVKEVGENSQPKPRRLTKDHKHFIHRVVLTGGPCGGKTTAQAQLTGIFEQLGWKVYGVREVATIARQGGATFTGDKIEGQANILKAQLALEQIAFDEAETVTDRNVLIICDRGILDNKAYVDSEEMWKAVLATNSDWTDEAFLARYDQVVHLVTAADGAAVYYTKKNNSIRAETPDEAITVDRKFRNAWNGHSNFKTIDNKSGWPDKLVKVLEFVLLCAGYPDVSNLSSKKRKWLIKRLPRDTEFPKGEVFDVEVIYLTSINADSESRLRKLQRKFNPDGAGNNDNPSSFQRTIRTPDPEGGFLETREIITQEEFDAERAQRQDPTHDVAKMTRRCFLHKQNGKTTYFVFDKCEAPPNCEGINFLSAYPPIRGEVEVPEFLQDGETEDVTYSPRYSMHTLTRKPNHLQE